MIHLSSCIKGGIYRIRSRNLDPGVFDGVDGFIGIRLKFTNRYLFTEHHHDRGSPFGTVEPLELIGMLPDGLLPVEHLSHERGDDWLHEGAAWIPTVRRPLRDGETPHGKRRGFVDEFLDGTRLPDDAWPCYRSNDALFDYLDALMKTLGLTHGG